MSNTLKRILTGGIVAGATYWALWPTGVRGGWLSIPAVAFAIFVAHSLFPAETQGDDSN